MIRLRWSGKMEQNSAFAWAYSKPYFENRPSSSSVTMGVAEIMLWTMPPRSEMYPGAHTSPERVLPPNSSFASKQQTLKPALAKYAVVSRPLWPPPKTTKSYVDDMAFPPCGLFDHAFERSAIPGMRLL